MASLVKFGDLARTWLRSADCGQKGFQVKLAIALKHLNERCSILEKRLFADDVTGRVAKNYFDYFVPPNTCSISDVRASLLIFIPSLSVLISKHGPAPVFAAASQC